MELQVFISCALIFLHVLQFWDGPKTLLYNILLMDILNLDGLRYATQEHFTLTFGKLNNKPSKHMYEFWYFIVWKDHWWKQCTTKEILQISLQVVISHDQKTYHIMWFLRFVEEFHWIRSSYVCIFVYTSANWIQCCCSGYSIVGWKTHYWCLLSLSLFLSLFLDHF